MNATAPALVFEHVSKSFPGVLALRDVTFEVSAGTCHALCGENGAGKSTLGKLLAGIHAPDSGQIFVFGAPVRFAEPREALAAGVGMVHQELSFCENLSVGENLCLSALPASHGFVSRAETYRLAEERLALIDAKLDVRQRVSELTPGQQQLLQIAAAVSSGARVIVFDEPTSSLSQAEAGRLYDLIARLKTRGVTSIYVSHRMEEIFRLCDAVTVLRDGQHVATRSTAALDSATLVEMMIGRRVEEYFPAHVKAEAGRELLSVRGLASPGRFRDISFVLRAGEVLGFAGLVGSGRSEIAQALFGLDPNATGEVQVEGRAVQIHSPAAAMAFGIGLVPEDRKKQGLVLSLSALSNTTLPILDRLSHWNVLRHTAERALGQEYFDRLRVRAPGLDSLTAGLSGGNQQKLVLAKWLAGRCRILILDEPTRGVDVGAKAEIHALIDTLCAEGHGVLLISSEMPEVLNLSTRLLVIRGGRIAGELARAQASPDAVMRLMAGIAA